MAKKHQIVPGTWNIRSSFNSFLALLVLILLIAAVYLTQNNRLLTSNSSSSNDMKSSRCNFFSGKWVFDNKTYPLYREQECTFMSDQLACQKFGRKDSSYQFWRWQPHQCDLPKSVFPSSLSLSFSLYLALLHNHVQDTYVINKYIHTYIHT